MKRVYTFFVMVISLSCWLNIAKAQTVRVPDANLAAVVRHTLSLAPNARITRQAMQRLTRLNAQPHYVRQITGQSGTIHNLTGLEHATGLTDLVLSGNQISNIRPLARLTNLEDLDLWSNQISDLKPLVGLTQLEYLDLSSNQISDLKPLVGLTQLNALVLGHNQIRDVTPLAGLTNLEELYLQGNPIQDASPLANLPNLTDTDIDIPEPPPIRIPDPNLAAAVRKALGLDPKAPIITQRAMLRLTILDARESQIANLSGLEYATQLTELYLYKKSDPQHSPTSKLNSFKAIGS